MVSSFSTPGFPSVHAHPTRLPVMDVRKAAIDSIEAMRAELHEIRDSAITDLRKAVESAVAPIRCHLALLRRDLAFGAGDGSDPAPMSSDDAEIPDLGYPKLPQLGIQDREGSPQRIPSQIQVHSIPPLLSSSPLLRAMANSPVQPSRSNDFVSATVPLQHVEKTRPVVMVTTTSLLFPISATFSTESAHAHSHQPVLTTTEATTVAHVLGFSLRKAGATKSVGLSHTNTTKRRHEVLRSLIYNLSHGEAKWHWILNSLLACYTDGKVGMNDVYLNKIHGWVGMYEVGKFVMVFHAEKVLDEIAKRQSEDAAGNLFDRMTPPFHNMVVCFQFYITIGEFWNGWDPGGGLAKILGVMLCSKHQENHCDQYPQFLIPQLHFINHAMHFTCLLQVMQYEELLLPSRDDEKSCTNICVSKKSFGLDATCVAAPILFFIKDQLQETDLSDFTAGKIEEKALEVMHVFSSILDGCVLRYLNLSDLALGDYGVNAFWSLLSSQNNLEEPYLMNMARLNMCHNTREWHCDVIRKIKWLNEKEISVMINIEGQANYEGFSDCIKNVDELTFKLLLYFQAVKAKGLRFTKLGSPEEAKKVVENMNDATASAKQLKEMEQGLTSLIVLGNGQLSDLITQLQDILESVNEADILPEKFDSAVIKAQIPQLAREIKELTSSGLVTIYNENSSSMGNYASYLVLIAALAAMGYCYMWWRDWSFSDVMYVTRHNMENVAEALIRELASKNTDFAGNETTNTLKMSECAMGTYLDLVCSLGHLDSNFGGALVIDLHAEFSLFFTCNLDFRLLWDPGDASAKAVKLILYFQYKDGKRMGAFENLFFRRGLPLKGFDVEQRPMVAVELKTCIFTSVALQVLILHNWWSYASSLAPNVEPSTTLLLSTEECLLQKLSPQAVLDQLISHLPSKIEKFTLRLQDSLVEFHCKQFQISSSNPNLEDKVVLQGKGNVMNLEL